MFFVNQKLILKKLILKSGQNLKKLFQLGHFIHTGFCSFFADEIIAMKRQIQASEETMRQIWVQVMEGLQESELLTLVAQEAHERDRYVAGLINLYETELKKLRLYLYLWIVVHKLWWRQAIHQHVEFYWSLFKLGYNVGVKHF